MNPYPVLTKLALVVHVTKEIDPVFTFWTPGNAWRSHVRFTPAEVLALADELKAFVNAQTQTTTMAELPSGDPT